MFGTKHKETTHAPPLTAAELSASVAPRASSIIAHASFPSGQSSSTTLDYAPGMREKLVTSDPTSPIAVAGAASSTSHIPPPHTAPTVFITPTTATAEPAPFPLITVGPILGLVTHTTARVLIECNTTMTVHARLTLIDRSCRRTQTNADEEGGDPSLQNIAAATKGAASPTQDGHAKTNGHHVAVEVDGVVQGQQAAIMTGMSSGSPVNGAAPPIPPPAVRTQEAAIMTGASSGSPVNGAGASPLPPHPAAASSPPPQPSNGSPGTTIGRADASAQVGSTSTEFRPAPATRASPTESEQREGSGADSAQTQPGGAGTFAPSSIDDAARDGATSAPFNRDASSAPVVGGRGESTMTPVKDGHVVDKDVECTAHRVSTMTFTGLQPDCRYELTFLNVKSRVTSTITTLIEGWQVSASTPFNVAYVSCNMVSITKGLDLPESDLWLDLRRRVAAHELDYVLHIGDQIYADEKRDMNEHNDKDTYQLVFKTGVEMLTDLPTSDWPACAVHIKELYRQLYRETWCHPPTAFVLANCPSLMIYDDHDFRDDWGNDANDSDPNSKEYYVGRCAQEVMCEYQRQLWDNVDFNHIDQIKKDFHMHVFGEHGIIFIDVRGPRSLHKIENDPYPYVGSLQWQELKDALSPLGIMRDVKSLLMICPAPIVFLPTTINDILGHSVIDDALGHWSSKPFKAEQLMLLNLCQAWKATQPERELTFIGGDVHVGGHSEIQRDGVVIFQQFVTSAIANHCLSQFEFFVGQVSQDLITVLEDGWGFKHRGFTRQRNYGLMQVAADDVGPLVKRRLVTPKGEKPEADNRRGTAHLK